MLNVLVATDLSPRSDRAVARALRLTGPDTSIRILHVIDEELPEDAAGLLKSRAEKAIAAQVAALSGDRPAPGCRPECRIVYGHGYRAVLEEAEAMNADLIVAGSHREETLRGYFLGTTVERVLRAGRFPVLMVREPAAASYRRVLVCVDFSVHARRAVESALALVPGGEAVLLHVYDVPFPGLITDRASEQAARSAEEARIAEMMENEMKSFVSSLAEPPATVRHVLARGSVREEIRRQAKTLEPDLIALGTHGRTGVARAFLGSVAEDLLDDPPCDILAVKAW